MYKVIGKAQTRTFRVLWMLEEIGQPYEHLPVAPASAEAKTYNPLGKIPALVDGAATLTDSVAIMTYSGRQTSGAHGTCWNCCAGRTGCHDALAFGGNGRLALGECALHTHLPRERCSDQT